MENLVLFDIAEGTQNLGDYIIMQCIMEEMDFYFNNFLHSFAVIWNSQLLNASFFRSLCNCSNAFKTAELTASSAVILSFV